MRTPRDGRERLFQTFAFYLVIIAVPLGVLIYQGLTTIENQRRQQEEAMVARLRSRAVDIVEDLEAEWRLFVEQEKLRYYEDFLPVTITDPKAFDQTAEGIQRSPLYADTVGNLAQLDMDDLALTTTGGGIRGSLPSLRESLHDSLIGYFQFDCATLSWTTPYDQVPPFVEHEELVDEYRRFLKRELEPQLIGRLGPVGIELPSPLRILVYLKASKVSTPQHEAPRGEDKPRTLIYEPTIFTFTHDNDPFIVGMRPVLLEFQDDRPSELLIQGYVFSAAALQLEIQAQLEPVQEEFGDLVALVDEANLDSAIPLRDPFQSVSIHWRLTNEEGLDRYKAELQRFGAVIGLLLLSLTVTMVHLSRVVQEQMDLNRKKNNFVSAVTHELKAPLTSIIMYAEMLEEGWARGKEQKYYHYIHWESERLTRLIKNILDFSGLERGTFKLAPACTVLTEAVLESLEPLRVWTDNSGLELIFEAEAEPEVMVDRDSLAQVIYNLCDNTIKYGMEAEKSRLTIAVRESEQYGILLISDNGPGIPKDLERRIFERFFRVENEMTREQTGTGLGLSLVKELIEGNGGRVEPFTPSGGGFGVKISLKKAPLEAMGGHE